jgi:hypothetical protein
VALLRKLFTLYLSQWKLVEHHGRSFSTLTQYARNDKKSRRYPAKEHFFTMAGIFNILMARAFNDKNQEQGKSIICLRMIALTLTILESSLFPSMLNPNIITGLERWSVAIRNEEHLG